MRRCRCPGTAAAAVPEGTAAVRRRARRYFLWVFVVMPHVVFVPTTRARQVCTLAETVFAATPFVFVVAVVFVFQTPPIRSWNLTVALCHGTYFLAVADQRVTVDFSEILVPLRCAVPHATFESRALTVYGTRTVSVVVAGAAVPESVVEASALALDATW